MKNNGLFSIYMNDKAEIVFLRMMLDDLLNDDKTALRGQNDPKRFFKPNGPQLSFASIWATPINGVTPDIVGAIAFSQWCNPAK